MGNSGSPVPINLPTGFRRVLIPKNGGVNPSQILNTSVQGCAAAGLKCAIYKADEAGLMKYMCSTVHDELVACVPDNEVEDYSEALQKAMIEGMEKVVPGCPIKVELKTGSHWK